MDFAQLVLTWVCIVIFTLTSILTCLSLVGIVKFQDSGQQKKLFNVLILEVVAICLGIVSGAFQLKDSEPVRPIKNLTENTSHLKSDTDDDNIAQPLDKAHLTINDNTVVNNADEDEVGKITSSSKSLDYKDITVGDQIMLLPKKEGEEYKFKLYDDRPRGFFGSFGNEIGELKSSQEVLVVGKYITPARGYKWLHIRDTNNPTKIEGWFSWENINTTTKKTQ